jgi:hypothetical protein
MISLFELSSHTGAPIKAVGDLPAYAAGARAGDYAHAWAKFELAWVLHHY